MPRSLLFESVEDRKNVYYKYIYIYIEKTKLDDEELFLVVTTKKFCALFSRGVVSLSLSCLRRLCLGNVNYFVLVRDTRGDVRALQRYAGWCEILLPNCRRRNVWMEINFLRSVISSSSSSVGPFVGWLVDHWILSLEMHENYVNELSNCKTLNEPRTNTIQKTGRWLVERWFKTMINVWRQNFLCSSGYA